jgi:hypothetical protein
LCPFSNGDPAVALAGALALALGRVVVLSDAAL